jgi:hypothetical protein
VSPAPGWKIGIMPVFSVALAVVNHSSEETAMDPRVNGVREYVLTPSRLLMKNAAARGHARALPAQRLALNLLITLKPCPSWKNYLSSGNIPCLTTPCPG